MCLKYAKEPRRGEKRCGKCSQCSRQIVTAAAKRDRRDAARGDQRARTVRGVMLSHIRCQYISVTLRMWWKARSTNEFLELMDAWANANGMRGGYELPAVKLPARRFV